MFFFKKKESVTGFEASVEKLHASRVPWKHFMAISRHNPGSAQCGFVRPIQSAVFLTSRSILL